MQLIAAYWLILDLTDSPVAVGALALVQTLPVTLVALVGRLDRGPGRPPADGDLLRDACCSRRRPCSAVLDADRAVAAWQLYVFGLVYGHRRRARAPRGTRSSSRSSGRRTSRTRSGSARASARRRASSGRPSAALVVATFGPASRSASTPLSYAIVIGCLLAIRLAPRPPRVRAAARHPHLGRRGAPLRRQLAAGRGDVLHRSPRRHVLVQLRRAAPLVAKLTLDAGARTFGLIASVFGCGALCGALILATVGKARLALVLGGAAGFGVLELVLAPQDGARSPICVLLFLAGICYVLWGSSALATLLLAAPEHLRGQRGEPLLLRVHGRGAARRPASRAR